MHSVSALGLRQRQRSNGTHGDAADVACSSWLTAVACSGNSSLPGLSGTLMRKYALRRGSHSAPGWCFSHLGCRAVEGSNIAQ